MTIHTPKGVVLNHPVFLCSLDCTQGRVWQRPSETDDLKLVNCDCEHQSPNAPAGYVSEVQCWDCPKIITPDLVHGFDDKHLDSATHPLCGDCFYRWTMIRPVSHDEPTETAADLLTLLIARCGSEAALALTGDDAQVFRAIADLARLIEKAVIAERIAEREQTLSALDRIMAVVGSKS